MIKEIKDVLIKYYKMIEDDKNKLIPYYIFYVLTIILDILIPIVVARITESITDSLYVVAFIMVFTLLLLELTHTLFRYFDMYFYSKFFKKNYITIYKKVINKLFDYDQEYQEKMTNGKIINSLTVDIVNIGEMADYFLSVILGTTKYLIISCYLLKLDYKICLFILFANFIYVNLGNYYTKKANEYYIEQRKSNDLLVGLINQTIHGLKDIKTMNLSKKLNNKYQGIYRKWSNAYTNKRTYQIKRIIHINGLVSISKNFVYIICLISVITNKITLGNLLIVISYFTLMYSSIESIISAFANIREENVSLNRISDLLSFNKSEKESKIFSSCHGQIEFKNVSFAYNNQAIIKNVSFNIQEKQITAIVGKNGSGKTTIVNSILRINKIDKGEILLDGEDIYTLEKNSYLKNISILNQDTYLFNFSIRENFNLIDNNSKKQESICKFIGIDSWIKRLPNGYDTIISEDSTNISGGQKRLLSLARTLLRGSKIIIFDEATSSLDLATTNQIIEILNKLKQECTVILITHKREIMSIADKIIIIDKGQVKGIDTHPNLLKENKIYQSMYQNKK